ncbi:MAG: glycosyltransferase [Bryobacteraceae bacterium]|nr:glycosyltransferase [Bryobacteraceae bacterium]
MRVAAVSDVTIGYGTPQLPLLLDSLREYLNAEVQLIEPVQPELAPRHAQYPQFEILPAATAEHPHSPVGRQEYIWRATRLIDRLKPDLLVICCTYSLPVLFRAARRPKKVLYYAIESIPFYGEFDVEMNRRLEGKADLVLFPEENRAVLEVGRCGFAGIPKLVLYNVSNRRRDGVRALPAEGRNGRILYSGTISRTQTFLDYYFSDRVRALPIDMFGPVKGAPGDQDQLAAQSGAQLRYQGRVSSEQLARLRPAYAYSIVAWNPDNENQLYAAPNKFFEAIADGVPPIAAPHPQCRLMIERYGCGILLADWSFDSFVSGLRRAMEIYQTPLWLRMVDNCRRAVEAELTWDSQFDKVKAYL